MENSIDKAIIRVKELYSLLPLQELQLLQLPTKSSFDQEDELLHPRKDSLSPQVHPPLPEPLPYPKHEPRDERDTLLKATNDTVHDINDYLTYGSLGIAIPGVPATLWDAGVALGFIKEAPTATRIQQFRNFLNTLGLSVENNNALRDANVGLRDATLELRDNYLELGPEL
jgi:hypothetical protein